MMNLYKFIRQQNKAY